MNAWSEPLSIDMFSFKCRKLIMLFVRSYSRSIYRYEVTDQYKLYLLHTEDSLEKSREVLSSASSSNSSMMSPSSSVFSFSNLSLSLKTNSFLALPDACVESDASLLNSEDIGGGLEVAAIVVEPELESFTPLIVEVTLR